MTVINRLVMHGFKSFAKRTELVFGRQFNCILGPNGSGKSNVLDALCFVLGKSSSKSLRAEKSSNLIYNGGKTKKAAERAEVSIFFDNSKKVFPTEDSEVKLSRFVNANGQSTYKINDKTRTRQEIVELLNLARINPDGYNIILQGDIVKFVEMHPVERRQLVEEIAGISVYEEKKQRALSELNSVEEKLKEAEIILAERETHLKELKKERNQAVRYKNLREQIDTNKATFLYRKMEAKNSVIKENQKQIDELQDKIEKVQNEIKKFKEIIAEKKAKINKINEEIERRGEKEQLDLHREVEQLKVSYGTNKNRIETLKNELNKIKIRKEQLTQDLKEADKKIDSVKSQKEDMESLLKHNQKELNEVEKRIAEFKDKNEMENAAELEKQIVDLDKKSEEIQTKIQVLRQNQQDLLRQKDKIEFQLNNLDDKIAKVIEVEKANKKQIDELKEKKARFKEATLELNKLLNDDSSHAAQLGEAREKLLGLHEELSKLKARSVGIKEEIAGNTALKEILKQKNSIDSIYGTVSELGQVDAKYSLALEIAAGNRIKCVVVEDDAVAAKCIKFLKDRKLGVVTFLPLNKIKPAPKDDNIKEILKSNGVHGLAIDLVTYDSKFKNVFSYVFGNAIVVDSIDVARRIGIGRAKMATLDGDMAELSGAMQGGYRDTKARIGFMEKEVVESIDRMEKDISDNDSLIHGLERKRLEAEERISSLRTEKANLEADIIKLEKLLHLEEGDLDATKKQKKELEIEDERVGKELEKLQQSITGYNKELTDAKTKKQDLREKITKIRNPRLLAELNAFEEKRSELREKLMKQKLDSENFDSQLKNMLYIEKENITRIIKQHDKEDDDFRKELKDIEHEIGKQESVLKEKEKLEKEFYKQFKDLFAERTRISDEVDEKEDRIEKLNEGIRKEEIELNTINLRNAEFKAEHAGMEKEFEQYRGVKVDMEKSDEKIEREIKQFERYVEELGAVNMKALEIYDSVQKEYEKLLQRKEKLKLEKEDVLVMMNEIDAKKKELFMQTFNVVNDHFKKFFTALSIKGEASLALENRENPFDAGLLIKVRITGSKFLDIRGLSGGEKTLTALAFIFSIQEHDPASFIIMDEVDAALDKRNSQKLAELIRKYTDRAQYVVISHNDGIISEADILYGVSMNEHGMSNIVSLKI